MINKKTKIVATLGPATRSVSKIVALARAGLNVARLNFSHGGGNIQQEYFKNIRIAEKITGQRIAILQDLQGPKIRLGMLPDNGVEIKKRETVIFNCQAESQDQKIPVSKPEENPKIIPVTYLDLAKDLKKGDTILIEDGKYAFAVIKIQKNKIFAKAFQSALLKSHKGLNCPTASISLNPLTKKDLEDLQYGLSQDVDFVALSFVRTAKDILDLKKIIARHHSKAKVIAKIERHEALDNLEEIIAAADGIMVARGDLGVEIPLEEVPLAQKRMVSLAIELGKPVIIATEMLQSMITNARATRAEISDAATGVFQHADALMLSNETAVGSYPVEAVKTLSKVALSIEEDQRELHKSILSPGPYIPPLMSAEITYLGAKLADEIKAKYLVAYTDTGYTALQLSKQRIFTPIITITPSEKVARQLSLTWGINNVIIKTINLKKELAELKKLLHQKFKLKKGDKIVIVSNSNSRERLITSIIY